MNAIEILGLACVDARFRDWLFKDVEAVIIANKVDLTWAEEAGLRRITGEKAKIRRGGARKPAPLAAMAAGSGADEGFTEEPNTLKEELEDVGDAIARMWCPEVPCPWPTYFTQSPPPDASDK